MALLEPSPVEPCATGGPVVAESTALSEAWNSPVVPSLLNVVAS